MRSLPIRLALLAAAAAALATPARAQDTTVVAVGTRLRITTDLSAVTGALQPSPRDSIVIERDGGPLALPRERVVELERFAGQRTYRLRGALIGGAIGAIVVGTLVYLGEGPEAECDPDTDPVFCNAADEVVSDVLYIPMALLGGLVGGGVGALIGSFPRDQYEPVPDPWRVE